MGLDSKYGDPEVKSKGKWFSIKGEETEVKIRHLGNEDFQSFLREHREVFPDTQPSQGVIVRNGASPDIDEGELEDTLSEGIAQHILTDWKKLSLDDPDLASEFDKAPGEYIAYSEEHAIKLFELLPPFRAEVFRMAGEEEAFRKEQEEEDEKN